MHTSLPAVEPLIAEATAARRLDCDPRRFRRIAEAFAFRPDHVVDGGRRQWRLYRPGRVTEFREIINKEAA